MEKESLIRLADLIAKMFSPCVETVVHDMEKKEFPIIAIFNNILSGRAIGDASSIFGELDEQDDIPDQVINYEFVAPNKRRFRSSSIVFKKNNRAHIALSINFDKEPIKAAVDLLSQFGDYTPEQVNLDSKEQKQFLTEKDLQNEILKVLIYLNIPKSGLQSKHSQSIIQHLCQTQYFNHHGAVSVLSKELAITRPTIYKYIKKYQEN